MNQTDSPFLWLRNGRNVDTFTDLFNGGIGNGGKSWISLDSRDRYSNLISIIEIECRDGTTEFPDQ